MIPTTLPNGLLLYGVFPLWLAAGVADAWCHRRSDLPHSSGVFESALHLVMLAQVGLGTLMVLFLEVTAPVLLVLALIVVLHTLTTYWDLAYTLDRRRIGAFEQLVHGWLELLPFIAFMLLALAHWPQMRLLLDADASRWAWRLRDPPLSPLLILNVLGLSLLFAVAPAVREFIEAWRARAARLPPGPE